MAGPRVRQRASRLNQDPEAVTYAREQAGLTKSQLARAVGVSPQLMGEIESGWRNATPAVLNRLAEVLDCPRVALERRYGIGLDTEPTMAEPTAVASARAKSGLSQADLARRASVPVRAIAKIEAGQRDVSRGELVKLAEALNCPLAFLERKRNVQPVREAS